MGHAAVGDWPGERISLLSPATTLSSWEDATMATTEVGGHKRFPMSKFVEETETILL